MELNIIPNSISHLVWFRPHHHRQCLTPQELSFGRFPDVKLITKINDPQDSKMLSLIYLRKADIAY